MGIRVRLRLNGKVVVSRVVVEASGDVLCFRQLNADAVAREIGLRPVSSAQIYWLKPSSFPMQTPTILHEHILLSLMGTSKDSVAR